MRLAAERYRPNRSGTEVHDDDIFVVKMHIGFHPLRPGEIPNEDAIIIEDLLCALPREGSRNASWRFERCNEMVFELYQDCLPAFGADRGRVSRACETHCTVDKRNQDGWTSP